MGATTKYLDQFNYQILGQSSSPKLVFLHGLMGSAANWRKVTSYLEKAYHILAFDQRGHGRSLKPASGYQPEDYATDLARILDDLGWEKILLVGHSMGGRNAMAFTRLWPQRVIGLVIEDIGPNSREEGVRRIENLIGMVPTPFVDRKKAKEFLLEKFPDLLGGDPGAMTLAQYFYSNIEEKEGGGADWRFNKEGVLATLRGWAGVDNWPLLAALKVPTLVVRGEHSGDLPQDIFARMVAANPLIRGVEIPEAGHWVHYDQPETFVRELTKFFESL
jgi:esterase